jgi:hypothetical protein
MNTFFKPPLYLFLLFFLTLGKIVAQTTLNIDTKSGKRQKMPSYFNGFTRNHVDGYITRPEYESKFDNKVELYNQIENNFSIEGKKLYRIGHNITDGSYDYNVSGYGYKAPGWHWATEYGDGFDAEYVAQLISGHEGEFCNGSYISNDYPSITTRIGAGIRRFLYINESDFRCIYSGFAVTVNYKNSFR